MSDGDDDISSEDDEKDVSPRKLTTKEEVGQYLYEVASTLESSSEAYSQIGVEQCLAVVEKVLDGRINLKNAILFGQSWECGTTAQQTVPCGSATSAVRRLSSTALHPLEIWVLSPNYWEHCSGCYTQTNRIINDYPLWVKGSDRYLYSTPSGKWRITNDTSDFRQGGGYIISSEAHGGSPPQLTEDWVLKNVIDNDVCVKSFDQVGYQFNDIDGDDIYINSNPSCCQYAVGGVPRKPVSQVYYNPEVRILSFPEHDLEVQLSPLTVFKNLTMISRLLSRSGVDCSSVPSNPSRLFLAAWQVSAGGHIDGTSQYFYHSETRETTWDLCAKLADFLNS